MKKMQFVWQYLGKTLQEFKVWLLGYRSYVALASQSGTNDPKMVILENTIGDIKWLRNSVGYYEGTLVGAFPVGKTALFIQQPGSLASNVLNKTQVGIYWNYEDVVSLFSNDGTGNPLSGGTDGKLNNTAFEIRVYL